MVYRRKRGSRKPRRIVCCGEKVFSLDKQKTLFIVFFIFLIFNLNNVLAINPIFEYKFDNSPNDTYGRANLTQVGGSFVTGYVNGAWKESSNTSSCTFLNDTTKEVTKLINSSYNFSLFFWHKKIGAWSMLSDYGRLGGVPNRAGGDGYLNIKGGGTTYNNYSIHYGTTSGAGANLYSNLSGNSSSWHFYGITWNVNKYNLSLYIDGNNYNSFNLSSTISPFNAGEVFELGCSLTNFPNYYLENNSYYDELKIYNVTLNKSQISEIYSLYRPIINIISPTNSSVMNATTFNINVSFNSTTEITYNSIDINVYRDNILENVFSYNIGNSTKNIIKNFSVSIEGLGKYNFKILTNYTIDNTNFSSWGNNEIFLYNSINFYIKDYSNNLISNTILSIENYNYSYNPTSYDISYFTENFRYLNVSAFATDYHYNQTQILINLSRGNDYNIYLTSYYLILNFSQNGVPKNISGFVAGGEEEGYTLAFTNQSYYIDQSSFEPSIVRVFLTNSVYNGTNDTFTWENVSQFYEYDTANNIGNIVEDIVIFESVEKSANFQVMDNGRNIIKGAKIRLYSSVVNRGFGGRVNYSFYGQRLTDNTGEAIFKFQKSTDLLIVITKEGYKTKVIYFNSNDINGLTKEIFISQQANSGRDDLFIGGLFKHQGSNYFENKFNNRSCDYYLYITDNWKRNIFYNTNYSGINRTISLNSVGMGVVELKSNRDFSSSSNDSILVNIYLDNNLTYSINIPYYQTENKLIIDTSALSESKYFRASILFSLILTSTILGLLFNTSENDLSLHLFMGGCVVLPVLVSGLGYLSVVGITFYLGRILKRFFSE